MAPFPGGRASPGHFVPGGGSFFSSPFIFYDQTFAYVGSNSIQVAMRFDNLNSAIERQDLANGPIAPMVIEPSLPQQFIDTFPAQNSLFSVRRLSEEAGSDAIRGPSIFDPRNDDLGVWYDGLTTREWSMVRPVAGVKTTNTSIYELSLTADTSTVLARATRILSYDNP